MIALPQPRKRALFWQWKDKVPYPIWDVKNFVPGDKDVQVGHTRIGSIKDGEICISTVFLETDHNHCHGCGKPVLFETMVFGGEYDQQQWRYHTYREALRGHQEVVEKVRRSL
jgi:hypothetical protein